VEVSPAREGSASWNFERRAPVCSGVMFSTLDTKFSLRRQWPFGTALLTQFALLSALLLLSGAGGGHRRAHIARASAHPHDTTNIYFQPPEQQAPPPPADSQAPELAEVTPVPPTAKPAPATDDATRKDDAKATDEPSSGDDMVAQLWEIDTEPETMVVMEHTVRTAQPVFTPEPPILRHNAPASVRGKDLVLEVLIAPDGTIVTAEVVQEVDLAVEQSIVETLRNWRFEPARFAGRAVPSRRQLSFHFPG